jgi:hypothetical protein
MEETIISWNLTNWVTIVLMATLGLAIIGFATKAIKGSAASAATA